jgi:spermidine/putrescine transport system permease protein
MASPPINLTAISKGTPKWLDRWLMLAPAGLWLALLLVLPTLIIFELSLVAGVKPGDIVNPTGFANYLRLFEAENLLIVGRSLFFAVATSFFCLGLGFPVAYWLALRAPRRWQNLLLLGFVLPLWTSSLLRSYAWLNILSESGVLNGFLGLLGLPKVNLLSQVGAVLIGMVYNLLPYMVLILYASLEKLDRRLLEAAADLGATPRQAFLQVTLPQTLPGVAAGTLLVFINALGDYTNPDLLGGSSSMTIARLLYNKFLGTSQDWGLGSAMTMLLIMTVATAIALLVKYGDKNAKQF